METVVASIISSSLLFAGTVYTVRRSRHASSRQHEEQTAQLTSIQANQSVMLDTIRVHRENTEVKLDQLHDRVSGLSHNQDLLFNMVAEVDSKVTKPAKKRISVQGDLV